MVIQFAKVKPVKAVRKPKPPKLTKQMLETLVEARAENMAAKRGRPSSGKVRVTLLLDPDVVARFKAGGAGWQARMNEALRSAK